MQENIIESLSPIERRVLPFIKENTGIDEISSNSGLDNVSVLRAIEFLKNKNIVTVKINEEEVVSLGENGKKYLKDGVPEKKILRVLVKSSPCLVNDIIKSLDLGENEIKGAIGTLKRKALIEIREGKIFLNASEKEINKDWPEESLLKKLPCNINDLNDEEKFALNSLMNMKDMVSRDKNKHIFVSLTEEGKKISLSKIDDEYIEQLTRKIILDGSYKNKKFRRYDIVSSVPKIYGGKKHFVNQATDYAKRIWLDMGFREMSGGMVVNSFWNFDVLFTAQDHPVREMQDTFFIKNIKGKLPDKKIVDFVKKSHEVGVGGSKGWEYKFDEDISKKVLLRTHTTCISAKTLKEIYENKEFPAKYFALGKCFRNETVDWKHSFEFNQTEGIVVDENANFRQLLGYLVEFFKKMGYEEIRIRPSYFPYTEPSLEIDYWNKERGEWLEIGGAGMFRPEVTIPIFGKHIPVLAWGPGFDRIIMESYEIKDLREMYKNNITKLREMKFWEK